MGTPQKKNGSLSVKNNEYLSFEKVVQIDLEQLELYRLQEELDQLNEVDRDNLALVILETPIYPYKGDMFCNFMLDFKQPKSNAWTVEYTLNFTLFVTAFMKKFNDKNKFFKVLDYEDMDYLKRDYIQVIEELKGPWVINFFIYEDHKDIKSLNKTNKK